MKTKKLETSADSFIEADREMDKLVDKTIGEVEGTRKTWVNEDLKHVVSCEVYEGE